MAGKSKAQALKKLEDQLTCAICLDAFRDPKLLQCFHVYCKECLERLVVKDQQGQVSVRCPTCRRSTLLPLTNTVADLQTAFHIHHLFEIQDAFEKVKEPQKVQCGKCKLDARPATSYCRDCGEFICATCADVHRQWDTFAYNVYVTDYSNNRIQVFAENAQFLRQIGRRGSGKGELNGSAMIAIDSEDKVYVTEGGNHRVSVFTSDGVIWRMWKWTTTFSKSTWNNSGQGRHGVCV